MNIFLLFLVILFSKIQSVSKKEYTRRTTSNTPFFYLAIAAFFSLLFFIISSGFKFNFSTSFLIYAILFGACTTVAEITTIYAYKSGPLSVNGLVLSYSLLVPTLYGIIFLKERLSICNTIGLVLILITLLLMHDKKDGVRLSLKWLITIAIAFCGHGLAATVQKIQQSACTGAYKNEFMIISLCICLISYIILSFVTKEDHKLKVCLCCGSLDGISAGVINLFVMILMASMPNAILFPTISGATLIAGFFISFFYYKEKLSKLQLLGYAIGTISIVLLNI